MRRQLAIPPEPLGRFVLGEITIRELGRLCGAHQDRVSRVLRALGVDTSAGAHKRRRLAHRSELAAQLPTGSAYETAAKAYRQGAALRDVAALLGCNKKAARQFLRRLEESVRPEWCREVFRYPDGRHRDVTRFARTLLALRNERGWSQAQMGKRCGLSAGCIGKLERAEAGPKWETLDKLADVLGLSREELGVTWEPLP
jgi:DNA-binding XRE family transcriptional regulator